MLFWFALCDEEILAWKWAWNAEGICLDLKDLRKSPNQTCKTFPFPLPIFTSPRSKCLVQFSSVQSLSHVRLCNPMNDSTPGLPVHHQLQSSLRLTSIESVMPSSHLILCRPLLLLPPIPPSIRVFSNEYLPAKPRQISSKSI